FHTLTGETMPDPLDETLAAAGRFLQDDANVNDALAALVETRATEVGLVNTNHKRKIAPVVAIGLAFAIAGGGAVAATEWTELFEPDIIVERTWKDDSGTWNEESGTFLGTCETHFVIGSLPPDTRAALRDYLGSLDIDSIEPDIDVVAAVLEATRM